MLSHSEDSTLPNKVVTLFNGSLEYRANCKKIKNNFYVINKHCFEVDGKWYREESGLVSKDYETEKWFLNDSPHRRIKALVDFKDGEPVIGWITENPYNNVLAKTKPSSFDRVPLLYALNSDILSENGYIEDISSGVWSSKKDLSLDSIRKHNIITNSVNYTEKGYNIEDNYNEAALKKKYYDEYDLPLTKDVRRYSKFLNDVTFGLELECSHGFIPDNLQNRMNLVVCRDGSLNDERGRPGPEFVTNPLRGAKGLQNIVNISNELKKRTLISTKCSLHIHLGNLPTSRLFLISLYVLSYKIQDEVYKMFPYYKTDYNAANKEKDYCQKLKKMNMGKLSPSADKEEYEKYINDNYTKLFYWLSQNHNGSGYNPGQDCNRKQHCHPVAQKWQRKNRYYWVNLMNTLFSTRNTVEFRLHTPTVNSQKIINWLFIVNAIARYAVLNSREILTSSKKITLSSVLNYYKDTFRIPQAEFLSEYLKAYVDERTEAFQKDYIKGDYLSSWELEGDKTYEFKHKNISHLF